MSSKNATTNPLIDELSPRGSRGAPPEVSALSKAKNLLETQAEYLLARQGGTSRAKTTSHACCICGPIYDKNISLFGFPRGPGSEKLLNQWLNVCQIKICNYKKSKRVCGKHFKKEDLVSCKWGGKTRTTLRKQAIPSHEPINPKQSTRTVQPEAAPLDTRLLVTTPKNVAPVSLFDDKSLIIVVSERQSSQPGSSPVPEQPLSSPSIISPHALTCSSDAALGDGASDPSDVDERSASPQCVNSTTTHRTPLLGSTGRVLVKQEASEMTSSFDISDHAPGGATGAMDEDMDGSGVGEGSHSDTDLMDSIVIDWDAVPSAGHSFAGIFSKCPRSLAAIPTTNCDCRESWRAKVIFEVAKRDISKERERNHALCVANKRLERKVESLEEELAALRANKGAV